MALVPVSILEVRETEKDSRVKVQYGEWIGVINRINDESDRREGDESERSEDESERSEDEGGFLSVERYLPNGVKHFVYSTAAGEAVMATYMKSIRSIPDLTLMYIYNCGRVESGGEGDGESKSRDELHLAWASPKHSRKLETYPPSEIISIFGSDIGRAFAEEMPKRAHQEMTEALRIYRKMLPRLQWLYRRIVAKTHTYLPLGPLAE